MSPLACSLLVLTSVLAAADAQIQACTKVLIGQRAQPTHVPVVRIPPGGGQITIPDYCQRYGTELVGESVNACNADRGGLAPVVHPVDRYNPSMPVDVICMDGYELGATAYIVQYCQ